MEEEDLEDRRHGASLSKCQSAEDQVRGERGCGNRDCATRPFASGWIRTVRLVVAPEAEGEGFQREWRAVFRQDGELGFRPEFREVEVLPPGTRPIARKDAWVCPCRLSIKLDGEGTL